MTDNARVLFLRPFTFQEIISALVLIPIIYFLFMHAVPGFKDHLLEAALYASATGAVGFVLGFLAKYILVKPAVEALDRGSPDPDQLLGAARSASIMPLTEAIIVFLRWSLTAIIMCVVPFYMQDFIDLNSALFGANALVMTALSIAPFYYLAAENSLFPFYMQNDLKGIIDEGSGLFRMSLNRKLLLTILLIAVPPIGNLLGLIYLSINSGLKLESIQFAFLLIIVQTVIMTLLNSYLIMKSLKVSVGRMSFMLKDMARGQGDLTKRLEVTGLNEVGELAFWFNSFMNDIERIVSHVRETSLELHQAIEDVSIGSQDLSQSTQEQAASVEEISASIEEMYGSVRQNSDLIREGEESSRAITKLIDQSKEVFGRLMNATQGISRNSKKIGDIVSTVNEVAFHTNLLALNASVEAARAGEHGKGFAVVAGEVRSLAQRSAQAASEIKLLIEETVERIKTGDEVMDKTSSSLEELMTRMEFFFRMMETISSSSMEQTSNIGELTRAISQIDGTTQQNASTVEELAGTLENLRTAAQVLTEDVRKFKTSDD
ncbi:MAG TPA: methyl-accepting chemotaxis protein [Deltaproteobacteria bacterium]|nr:methyl-accepting chemotaxis protein [Deltaproteobacteria bacterium]